MVTSKDYIDLRLKDWAAWLTTPAHRSLGFPQKNLVYRMMHEGHVLIRNSSKGFEFKDSEEAEIDDAIQLLRRIEPNLAHIIYLEYLEPGTQLLKAKRMQLSVTQYRVWLDQARVWLYGYLCSHKLITCK